MLGRSLHLRLRAPNQSRLASSLSAAYVQSARAKLLDKAQSVAIEMREQGKR